MAVPKVRGVTPAACCGQGAAVTTAGGACIQLTALNQSMPLCTNGATIPRNTYMSGV
jgi:hypothetical protein